MGGKKEVGGKKVKGREESGRSEGGAKMVTGWKREGHSFKEVILSGHL